ncbi:MAG: hypothetical protein AAF485_20085, partial [Chloroflexota bacterium]
MVHNGYNRTLEVGGRICYTELEALEDERPVLSYKAAELLTRGVDWYVVEPSFEVQGDKTGCSLDTTNAAS